MSNLIGEIPDTFLPYRPGGSPGFSSRTERVYVDHDDEPPTMRPVGFTADLDAARLPRLRAAHADPSLLVALDTADLPATAALYGRPEASS